MSLACDLEESTVEYIGESAQSIRETCLPNTLLARCLAPRQMGLIYTAAGAAQKASDFMLDSRYPESSPQVDAPSARRWIADCARFDVGVEVIDEMNTARVAFAAAIMSIWPLLPSFVHGRLQHSDPRL
jgi:hypothetical protein